MFLIRAVLEDTGDFETALAELSNSNLMAPCYIIVAGTKPGYGAVLSRTRGQHPCRTDLLACFIDQSSNSLTHPPTHSLTHSLTHSAVRRLTKHSRPLPLEVH